MTRNVELTNHRGQKLAVILSSQGEDRDKPIILLLQGFLGKKDGEKIESLSNHLISMGFGTVRFDYPGYGESGGEINDYLITNIVDDVGDILHFVQSDLGSPQVGIWGQSMGGMLAIISASLYPETIKAVCVVSAPAQITIGDDLEKITKTWQGQGFLERRNSQGELIRIPYNFVKDARKWNAQKAITKITTPVLVVSGKSDDTVPPEITRGIYQMANEPKSLIEIENMPHDYKVDKKFVRKINEISGNFFSATLNSIPVGMHGFEPWTPDL